MAHKYEKDDFGGWHIVLLVIIGMAIATIDAVTDNAIILGIVVGVVVFGALLGIFLREEFPEKIEKITNKFNKFN